jgi:hypothetical protein
VYGYKYITVRVIYIVILISVFYVAKFLELFIKTINVMKIKLDKYEKRSEVSDVGY